MTKAKSRRKGVYTVIRKGEDKIDSTIILKEDDGDAATFFKRCFVYPSTEASWNAMHRVNKWDSRLTTFLTPKEFLDYD